MNLNITYSIKFETARVAETLEELDRFKKSGCTVALPASLELSDLNKITRAKIQESIKNEYSENDYAKPREYLLNNWTGAVFNTSDEFIRTNLKARATYRIYLTRYGAGGSHRLPNEVIVNIRDKYNEGLLRTITHEIIHLMIQPYILKYKVYHWSKERTVDLLMAKFAPQLIRRQKNLPVNTRPIDDIFHALYPRIEELIQSAGKLGDLSKKFLI